MPFVEVTPGQFKAGRAEHVTVGHNKHGSLMVSVSGDVARRNELHVAGRCRILVDVDGPVRRLRLISDKTGPFGVRKCRGDAASIVAGRLPMLGDTRVTKTIVEWDENDADGKPCLDIDLPAQMQPKAADIAAKHDGLGLPSVSAAVKKPTPYSSKRVY